MEANQAKEGRHRRQAWGRVYEGDPGNHDRRGQGGGDPAGNARLRTAIDAAKADNMPHENIERAIKKGTGELEGSTTKRSCTRDTGRGAPRILIEATTDNPNRTVAEIRHAFSRNGGNLGATNSVAWMFDRKGQIYLDAGAVRRGHDAGSRARGRGRGFYARRRPYVDHHRVAAVPRRAGRAQGQEDTGPESAEIAHDPEEHGQGRGTGRRPDLLKLMEALEEMDDVAKVSSNFDIDAEAMAAVTG